MPDNYGVVGAPSTAVPSQPGPSPGALSRVVQAPIQPAQVLISNAPTEQIVSTISTLEAKVPLSDTVAPFAAQQTTEPAVEYVPMTQPLPIELKLPPRPDPQPVQASSEVTRQSPPPVPVAVSQPPESTPVPAAEVTPLATSIPAQPEATPLPAKAIAPPAETEHQEPYKPQLQAVAPNVSNVQSTPQEILVSKIYSNNTRAVWSSRRSMKILYIAVVVGTVIFVICLVLYLLLIGSPVGP